MICEADALDKATILAKKQFNVSKLMSKWVEPELELRDGTRKPVHFFFQFERRAGLPPNESIDGGTLGHVIGVNAESGEAFVWESMI